MLPKQGQETSQEMRALHRMQLIYSRKTRERQIFMEDLRDYRKRKDKRVIAAIIKSIGPRWYQALSVPQRNALDTLEACIYKDLLEGRPSRTQAIMRTMGIIPRPSVSDLMRCIYLGREDPKETLAQLFLIYYGHTIDGKRMSYDLNGRLLLSGILYLGFENLLHLLRETFRPDEKERSIKPKPKRKHEPPLASPYLQTMVAYLYEPTKCKRKLPLPLPNLDDLNEPLEATPPLPKAPPPPLPPPPPKKRLPRTYCDKLAGVAPIEPYISTTVIGMDGNRCITRKRQRRSKYYTEEKKVYGIGSTMVRRKGGPRRKPKAPTTGLGNSQYTICGVYIVNGKSVFVLGNISILPASGDLIHGGYAFCGGEYISIHCGYRGFSQPAPPDPCDCVTKWTERVFKYVRKTKCYCGHNYDYDNEGRFPAGELPFFNKPTRHTPFQFNYNTIFDIDPKSILVEQTFKTVWDNESMLRVNDRTENVKKPQKKKKRSSTTCLGNNPEPKDYLKCALHHMRRVNIAARLPDIHLVPELIEWMRRRLYGPRTHQQVAQLRNQSNTFWGMFKKLAAHGVPHVPVPQEEEFAGHTTWTHKQSLNNKFRVFIDKYKLKMFRKHAQYTNMLWPSMCQAEFPDKKFREIYFSYLFANITDIQLMHPYSSKESAERYTIISKRPYRCLPAKVEPQN